jgi:hypothetical protein
VPESIMAACIIVLFVCGVGVVVVAVTILLLLMGLFIVLFVATVTTSPFSYLGLRA